MEKKSFERFLRRIIALGHQIETPFARSEPDIHRMWISDGHFFSLPPDGILEYGAIIRDLLKTPSWTERFSPAYIQQRVKPLMELVFLGDEASVSGAFARIGEELDAFADRQTVFLPITGVDLEDSTEWERGPVKLHKTTEDFLQSFCNGRGIDTGYIRKNSNAQVWAECSFIAEPKRAQALAEDLCGRLIDVLRFWMAATAQPNFPVGIALEGDFADGSGMRIIRGPAGGIIWDHSRARGVAPLPIGPKLMDAVAPIECLLDWAFDPGKQTLFANLIMRSVRSFGRGKVSPHGEDRVLGYMIALEAFLNEKDIPLSDSVSEGVATVLGGPIEGRVELKRVLKKIYGLRSRIAHGASVVDLDPADVRLLENKTIAFIVAMIGMRDQFQSKRDFLAHLERQRMS